VSADCACIIGQGFKHTDGRKCAAAVARAVGFSKSACLMTDRLLKWCMVVVCVLWC
jgi:hypothetical protein